MLIVITKVHNRIYTTQRRKIINSCLILVSLF